MTNDHEAYVVALRHSDCGMFQSRVEDAIFVMATNDEKSDVTSPYTASWKRVAADYDQLPLHNT